MRFGVPRLVVAGLSGDSGKTLLTLGMARALTQRGLSVRAFKKGPDYIDAAWLAAAVGAPCRNLDTFLMSEAAVRQGLGTALGSDLVLLEGNRGLFDGFDARGTHSTAELARLLETPVLLVVDVTKTTRTVAALVLGCREMDRDLDFAGVVLNRVGTSRQERLIREAVEAATGIPVIGAIPRVAGEDLLPGRHLGLVTAAEHPHREAAVERAAEIMAAHVDLDRVLEAAGRAGRLELEAELDRPAGSPVRVGLLSDHIFSFYYPENLESLESAGAELVRFSPLEDRTLPALDGLYIGGGFPEVHVRRLAANQDLARSLKKWVAGGLPVYAECGGLMYLARELVVDGVAYPMAGVLDLIVEQTSRPQGHGYEVATVEEDNPFHRSGVELRGHEFHYSKVHAGEDRTNTVLSVSRGAGTGDGRDGIVRGSVWASYLHIHARGTPGWADGFLALARQFASGSSRSAAAWA